MSIKLGQLDEKIQRLFKDNQGEKSMFRIALEELSPEEYSAIKDAQGPVGIAWARVAVWFYDFFLNGRGNNIINCSWNPHRERGVAEQVWNKVFQTPLNRDVFLSQCWALNFQASTSGTKGETSKIWSLGWKQLLNLGLKEWSDISNYDAPPAYLKILLENLDTATGRDFSEFVEDYLTGQADERKWYAPVFRAFQAYYCDGARFGEYLQWRGGAVPACMGVGVDHVRGNGESWDLNRKLPHYPHNPRAGFYPLEGYEGTVKHYHGRVEFTVSSQISGSVFYRCMSNPKDLRYHWWKRVPHDGIIPAGRNEILVCFDEQQAVNPQVEDDVAFESMPQSALSYRIGNENHSCQAIRFFIKSRPARESKLQLTEEWSVRLAGKVPVMEVASGRTDFTTDKDVPICAGECRFRVSDLAEGGICKWDCSIDGQHVVVSEEIAEYTLDSRQLSPGFHEVRLTVRIEGSGLAALYFHCLWLPQEVAVALKEGRDLPTGWQQKRPENKKEIIEDRLRGRWRCELLPSDGGSKQLFLPATGTDYWFARGTAMGDDSKMNEPKEFSCRGEAEDWNLILPGNLEAPLLEVAGGRVETQAEYFWNYVGEPSRWRIPLKDLLEQAQHEYVHSDNPQRAEIQCNGKTVATFLDIPEKAVLCQDTYGRWGVYLPSNDNGHYAVVLYTDNTLNPHFPHAFCQYELTMDGGRGRFYLLEDRISQIKREDSEGELLLALMPAGTLLDLAGAIENHCPIRVVRSQGARDYGSDQDHDRLQRLHHRMARALRKHPSAQTVAVANTRLARYQRPVTLEQARQNWEEFCSQGQLEELESELSGLLADGYNFLLDPHWYYNGARQLEEGLQAALGPRKHVHKHVQDVLQGSCSVLIGQQALDKRQAKNNPFFDEPFPNYGIQAVCRERTTGLRKCRKRVRGILSWLTVS